MGAEPARGRLTPLPADRLIGPIGTASRAGVGALAILLAGYRGDLAWWDVAAAVAGFPLVAAVAHRVLRGAWTRATPVRATHYRPASYAAGVASPKERVGCSSSSPLSPWRLSHARHSAIRRSISGL